MDSVLDAECVFDSSLVFGLDDVVSFYKRYYFDSFIRDGGSAIKFFTGKKGAGKSLLLSLLSEDAKGSGYYTFSFSAKSLLLSDLSMLYFQIVELSDLDKIITSLCNNVLSNLGYDDIKCDGEISAIDQLSNRGEADAITRQELKSEIKKFLLNNPYMDSNFALCVSLLSSNKIGLIDLDDKSLVAIDGWLKGNKDLKLSSLRSLGLLPYRITKFNARNMIRSFSYLVQLAGFSGLYIAIDDLDYMLSSSTLNAVRYTKMRRDDTYEAIRQLVDDVDSFRGIFLCFAFNQELLTNEKSGIKSYQALWLRIQNEIVSKRVNLFQSLIDMDALNAKIFTPTEIVRISGQIKESTRNVNISAELLNEDDAESIIEKSHYGSFSIPYLIKQQMLKIENKEGGRK